MQITTQDGKRFTLPEATAGALTGKEFRLVEVSAAGKVVLHTAGKPIGVLEPTITPQVTGAKTYPIALLNSFGTVKVMQAAAIAPGAKVMSNMAAGSDKDNVVTDTGAAATEGIGIKVGPLTNGAAGDIIEVLPFPESRVFVS